MGRNREQEEAKQYVDAWSLGSDMLALWKESEEWSYKTFGTREERGPIGPLKHLVHEAQEAQEKPDDLMEYADCYLVLTDALRRAGYNIIDLVGAALRKMEINRQRVYHKVADGEPSFHVK